MYELGDMVTVTLAAEIMGRCSNVVIINADGKIIDSIKRVDMDMSRERPVLPNMTYSVPPRGERLDFRTCTKEDIANAAEALPEGDLAKALLKIFEGISPIVAREWVYYAAHGRDAAKSELNGELLERLAFAVEQSARECREDRCVFTAVKDSERTA